MINAQLAALSGREPTNNAPNWIHNTNKSLSEKRRTAKMKRHLCHESFMKLYRAGQHTNSELSRVFRVTGATIRNWARREGLPGRRRGRPRLTGPTAVHRQILDLLLDHAPADVAARVGVSRQYVEQVRAKWDATVFCDESAVVTALGTLCTARRAEPKDRIVAFRVTSPEFEELRRHAVASLLSPGDAARRLVLLRIGRCGSDDNPTGLPPASEADANATKGACVKPQEAACETDAA
jgi:hypothetical protein